MCSLCCVLCACSRGTNLFPGFDPEVQGVYREHAGENALRFHTYVLREGL